MTVELTDTIQLTTHFAINASDFFLSNSSVTNFINNLCALLNIVDTSRVKVVGVHSGSTIVTSVITPSTGSTVTLADGSVANNTDPSLSALASTISSYVGSGTYSQVMSNAGLGAVLKTSSVYYPISTD